MKYLRFLVLTSVLGSTTTQAEILGIGEDTFTIGLGGVFANFDTEIRVDDRTLDLGTVIDLEDDLNFDDSETYLSLGAAWRFAPRHRIGLFTTQTSRDSGVVTNEDIEFEDTVIPAGSNIVVDFDLDMYAFTYLYSFVQTDKLEFSGAVGVHWVDAGVLLDSNALDIRRDADVQGPLPNFGLDVTYAFSERWRGHARAMLFALEYDKYDGSLQDYFVGIEYMFNNGLSIGGNYSYFRTDVDVDSANWFGSLKVNMDGPSIFLNYHW